MAAAHVDLSRTKACLGVLRVQLQGVLELERGRTQVVGLLQRYGAAEVGARAPLVVEVPERARSPDQQ